MRDNRAAAYRAIPLSLNMLPYSGTLAMIADNLLFPNGRGFGRLCVEDPCEFFY